jgi:hypothetical protein
VHWIETVFHVDPDGGSGFLEGLWIAAFAGALGVPVVRRIVKRRSR